MKYIKDYRGGLEGAKCKWCGKGFPTYDNTYIQHEIDCRNNNPQKVQELIDKYFRENEELD